MATIPEYYQDKIIFITGATGFIGKVLVEKLLRSCPEIQAIYCLTRPKQGEAAADRLNRMLSEPLFDNLRNEQPEFMSKVHAVSGDIAEDGLGLQDDQKAYLEDNINVVFHSASTTRFDEQLKVAVNMNLLAVQRMVKLCKGFKKLEVFVHVSSAFANCERPFIEEIIYPSPVEPQKLIDAMEWLDDDAVRKITTKLIGRKPNTYTYTKQLAEVLLVTEGADLPLAIVRPSIVTASWMEPMPGWIDNLNGPSGLYVAAGKGLLRSMFASQQVVADFVPVDLPVNMMIAVAWARANATKVPEVSHATANKAAIYHITTGGLNPLTITEIVNDIMITFKNNPMESCFRRPKSNIITSSSFLHDCWILVSHMIPAYAVDLGSIVVGKKPRMVQMYTKLHKYMETMEYFSTQSWEWTYDHLDMLKSQMTPEDQKTFYFDPRMLHWQTYMQNYCLGTKKFVLKENESGIPAARAHLKKLRNTRYVFNTVVLVIMWRVLVANSSLARNSWFFVMGLVFKFVRFFRLTSTLSRS